MSVLVGVSGVPLAMSYERTINDLINPWHEERYDHNTYAIAEDFKILAKQIAKLEERLAKLECRPDPMRPIR